MPSSHASSEMEFKPFYRYSYFYVNGGYFADADLSLFPAQCAFVVPPMLEDIFDLIEDLNNTLFIFSSDLAHHSGREELQWPLQNLYEEYLNYCLVAVRYLRRSPQSMTS